MRCILSILLLLTLSACPARAAFVDAYPPDPKGARVMDRSTQFLDAEEGREAYAVLYRLGDLWYVDVYRGVISEKGVEWAKVYRWKLVFQGERYVPAPVTVLRMARDGDKVQVFMSEVFRYHEGRVSIYLDWDLKTNKFREDFSD